MSVRRYLHDQTVFEYITCHPSLVQPRLNKGKLLYSLLYKVVGEVVFFFLFLFFSSDGTCRTLIVKSKPKTFSYLG